MSQEDPYHRLIADLRGNLGSALAETIANAISRFVNANQDIRAATDITMKSIVYHIECATDKHVESYHTPADPPFTRRQESVISRIALNAIETHIDALHNENDYDINPDDVLKEITTEYLVKLGKVLPDFYRLTSEQRRAIEIDIMARLQRHNDELANLQS
jgi:hypothetical protein